MLVLMLVLLLLLLLLLLPLLLLLMLMLVLLLVLLGVKRCWLTCAAIACFLVFSSHCISCSEQLVYLGLVLVSLLAFLAGFTIPGLFFCC